MNCPKCGWNNPDDAAKCANCFAELTPSQPQQTQQMPPQPQQPQQPYAQQPYGQQPYAPQQPGQPMQSVPDHMVWSIVMTVISCICCLVGLAFSIIAIVKSSQANSKKAMGDFFGALQDANAAKTWLYWAIGLDIVGLIGGIIYFVGMAAMFSKGGMHQGF